jgi:L-ascorbate metabolism protein UlaG (beta-lactamase superfamily)
VIIDPYLSDHREAELPPPLDQPRATRAPLDPAEIDSADLILCTHDHFNHFDAPTLRSLRDASPTATLLCPNACIERADDLDWPGSRVAGMSAGDAITTRGLRISAFEVAHGEEEKVRGHERFLGYVVHGTDLTVVHVGDGRATKKLAATIRSYKPDVVFLPISGHTHERRAVDVAGSMSAAEAVELAVEAGAPLVIPMHYDMFPANADPTALADFERYAQESGLPARVAQVGELVVIEGVEPW